jgi:foldase protein PrsA
MATKKKSAASTKKSAPKSTAKAPIKTSARKKATTSYSANVAKSSAVKSTAKGNKSSENLVPQPMKVRKSYIYIALGAFLLLLFLYAFRGLFVAAVVNGQPIWRTSVVRETEKQVGKQALDTLIRNAMIEQEAKKQNVTVTDKEVDEEIKKVEQTLSKQGQKIDQVLALQGLTKDDLRKLIRLDKLVSKMVGKDIKVTDEDIAKYIEENRESLPQDQTEEQLKKTVHDTLRQQQLNQKVQAWLGSLKQKAKIWEVVQY